jgi:hypothetical protein
MRVKIEAHGHGEYPTDNVSFLTLIGVSQVYLSTVIHRALKVSVIQFTAAS